MKVTLPDGSTHEYAEGSTPLDVANGISEGLGRATVAAKVNGDLWDAFRPLPGNCALQLLTLKDSEGVEVLRHSCAHLLAQAVKRLYPDALPTIGPAIEHGFYYDFDKLTVKEEDLARIEAEMKKVVKEAYPVSRTDHANKEEALQRYRGNPYKVELIEEHKEGLSTYAQGEFEDLCRGPHVPNTKLFDAFKLTRIAGAYWRGDAKRAQLTRIYGACFPTKKELNAHLEMLARAEKCNHRVLGEELELFAHFDLIGKGLPVWLPKGEVIRREVERLALEREDAAGYQRVTTPNLAKKELFERSGHLPYYEESMYPPMEMDDGTYYLKAMNCPLHHLIYAQKPRSYRDLPVRLAEYGTCYRNELSGTLNGLLRVRSLRMNDAHIYCRKDQVEAEVLGVLTMIKEYFSLFGFENYWFRLSLGSADSAKYIDEPGNWRHAEAILRDVLEKLGLPFVQAEDEAAFYGPKIDVQFKNVYGREETMSTVQLDFAAKSRFDLCYVAESGEKVQEVFVIHRAPLSVHERFMAFLIEHYGGRFPLWLSPEQVRVLTIADRHESYAKEVVATLKAAGLRAELDGRAETTGKKIREAQLAQVNYILVVGDQEVAGGTVNVRTRDGQVHGAQNVEELRGRLVAEARERR